jgi:molybdenum cofactor cytidylyltransferase
LKRPTVLILASGRGERFIASGGGSSKLDTLLGDRTVLQHTAEAARGSGLPWHVEQGEHPGMGDSIAAAVRATLDSNGWLILPGDLPLIRSSTLCRIADELHMHPIVVPVYQGIRGHPVGFSARYRSALLDLTGSEGARRVVQSNAAAELTVNDVGCVQDVDTLDDLNAVKAILKIN